MPAPTRRRLVTAALLMGTFLAAIELNVVGTAMPTLVAQLGGLQLYGLVFSAYLLTSTVTIPLYGRLADLHGRRPVYGTAVGLFLLGSALCGASPSMGWLVAARTLQGLGAGGVLPVTITIFGDLYPAEQRATVQGLFSTVWGVSSVLGPLVGGFLVSYVSWRWVFWLNLPLGLAAVGLLLLSFREQRPHDGGERGLDLWGALLLVSCLVALMLGLQGVQEGKRWAAAALGIAALLLGGFVLQERRARAPLLPFALFKNRVLRVTFLGGLTVGGLLFSLVTFVPLYVQGVLHGSPTRAGLALLPLSVTWTLHTFATGPLARRLGYRPVVLLGVGLCALGAAALLLVPLTGVDGLLRHGSMVAVGAGMGLFITASTIAVQDSVRWDSRGMATALITFSRTVGGMAAVTLLSALVTTRFAAEMGQHLPPGTTVNELLDPKQWTRFDGQTLSLASSSLERGLRLAFGAVAGMGLTSVLLLLAFPPLRLTEGEPPSPAGPP